MGKEDRRVPNSEIEAARSSGVLINALIYLGSLQEPDMTKVEEDLQKPLTRLFEMVQERIKLGGRDRDLAPLIKKFYPIYPDATLWVTDTDKKHTVASFNYALEIADGEGFGMKEKKIVLSAILAHDCAYPITKDKDDARKADTRLTHMQDGVIEFKKFAKTINEEFPGFYSDSEIETVCSIIKQHDNPSTKIDGKPLQFEYNPPPSKLMWAHREADRLWMLDRGGFALDLIRKVLEDNPSYNPDKYLKHVISRHLEEANVYEDNINCIHYYDQKTLYRTKSGFDIFQRLIEERSREYDCKLELQESGV